MERERASNEVEKEETSQAVPVAGAARLGKKAQEREERIRRAREREAQRTLAADKFAGLLAEGPDQARAMAEGRYLSGLLHPDIVRHLPRPVPGAPDACAVALLRSTAEPDVLATNDPRHARGWNQAPSGALIPPPGVEFRLDIAGVLFTPAELLAALDAAELAAAGGWRVYERIWQVEAGELTGERRELIQPRWIRHDEHGPRWLMRQPGWPQGLDMTLEPMKFVAERDDQAVSLLVGGAGRAGEEPAGGSHAAALAHEQLGWRP